MIWRKGWIELRLHRWNGCFGKMDDHPDHTTPNHHPPKMDVLPKTFLRIILAAKGLVRHSSTCPKQQRWHLPFSLFLILFYLFALAFWKCRASWLNSTLADFRLNSYILITVRLVLIQLRLYMLNSIRSSIKNLVLASNCIFLAILL